MWSAKVAHIWSFSLTIISTCVHHTSTEFPHAIGLFNQKFVRKSLSDMWCESVVWVLSWLKSSIWSFVAPQEKEISSRTTLQSFSWVENDMLGTKGVAVWFWKSVEFSLCFNDLELIELSRTIGNINVQVRKSILSCLAHR